MNELLRIKNLSVSFDTDDGKVKAVDNVSFSINRNEVLGLVGESGCGKSVTSMSILRLIPSPPGRIESGEILFEDKDLLSMPVEELRKIRGNKISVIFQEPMTALSPLHRIGRQLVEAFQFHKEISGKKAWQESEEWLSKVGIPDAGERMYSYPFQLSGGMRQRVMIAMALMLKPDLIIADEPTTALDVTIQAQIFDLINKMKEDNTSLLLITHDMGVIWEMCTRVAVMYASEIVESGPVKDIFNNPRHPYTEALLKSIPSLKHKEERLETIRGQVPSPLNYPAGCRFRERCKYAFDRCAAEHPEIQTRDGKQIRCFLREQEKC